MSVIMENVTINDLEGEQKEIAQCVGLEGYKRLVLHFGGTSIYVPKSNKISPSFRDAEIKRQFNGYNYKALARKFDLSESRVRTILSEI